MVCCSLLTVCMCVCACVYVCVRVSVRACVCAPSVDVEFRQRCCPVSQVRAPQKGAFPFSALGHPHTPQLTTVKAAHCRHLTDQPL